MPSINKLLHYVGVTLIGIGAICFVIVSGWGIVSTCLHAWNDLFELIGWWSIIVYVFLFPLLILIVPWYELIGRGDPHLLMILFVYPLISFMIIIAGAGINKLGTCKKRA